MPKQIEPSQDINSSTRYRMQFVLGPYVPTELEDWQQFRVGDDLHLSAHPDLNVEQSANTSVSVTLTLPAMESEARAGSPQ